MVWYHHQHNQHHHHHQNLHHHHYHCHLNCHHYHCYWKISQNTASSWQTGSLSSFDDNFHDHCHSIIISIIIFIIRWWVPLSLSGHTSHPWTVLGIHCIGIIAILFWWELFFITWWLALLIDYDLMIGMLDHWKFDNGYNWWLMILMILPSQCPDIRNCNYFGLQNLFHAMITTYMNTQRHLALSSPL